MQLPPEFVQHLLDPINKTATLADLMRLLPCEWRAKQEYQALLASAKPESKP